MENNTNEIIIKMLGRFNISNDNADIDVLSLQSEQLMQLLQYLIINRHKNISQDDLINMLWDEDIKNSAGALKNLVYRARMTFVKCGMKEGKDLIVSKNGGYSWNNDFTCNIDIEEFERICAEAKNKDLEVATRINLYKKAVDCYQGDFVLGNDILASSVVSLDRYYQNLYFKSVYNLIYLLEQEEEYIDMFEYAQRAIEVDQFEETAHQLLMQALIHLGKNNMVETHYHFISNLFYEELNVTLSDKTKQIYQSIFKTENNTEMSLEKIKKNIDDSHEYSGAIFCDYSIFKQLYQAELKKSLREESNGLLVLITLTDLENNVLEEGLLEIGMEQFKFALLKQLRLGDAVAKYSKSQYICILYKISPEYVASVVERVKGVFDKLEISKNMKIITDKIEVKLGT